MVNPAVTVDFSEACRTCLNGKGLIHIFENPDESRSYSNDLLMVAGIKIKVNDGLPQKICRNCVKTLNDSLEFRKNCREVETQLLKLKESKPAYFETEIKTEPLDYDNITLHEEIDIRIKEEVCDSKHDIDDKLLINNEDKLVDGRNDLGIEDSLLDVKTERQYEDSGKPETKGNMDDEDSYQELLSDGKTQRVTCRLCQKDLSIRSIDNHMARMHPGADERKVKCELCDSYVVAVRLTWHVARKHGVKEHRCAYCKIQYASKEELLDHVSTCNEKKNRRNLAGRQLGECDVCHKRMQKASIRKHKAVTHAGLGPICEHCGKKFGNKFRLKEHYRAKHGYEKFKCSYCEFQSSGIMSMRNHERRHRGEKPFICEVCGAKFHAAYLLAQHRQSHRTEKTVKCDRCPARFKARNSLHAHRRTQHAARDQRRAGRHQRHNRDADKLHAIDAPTSADCTA